MSQREACSVAEERQRERGKGGEGGEGWREGGGGVIPPHCLIGCCCVCGAGVTDARGCSASTRGSIATVTLSNVLLSHTQSACGSFQQLGGGGAGVGGGGGDGGSDRGSWQMQLVEASEAHFQRCGTRRPSEA